VTRKEILKHLDEHPDMDWQERDAMLIDLREVYKTDMLKRGRSRWFEALQMFDDMQRQNCDVDAGCFTSAIRACGDRMKKWEHAFSLFADMRDRRLRPNVDTANGLMSACNRAKLYRRSLDTLEYLRRFGIRLNEDTFSHALLSCSRGGYWEEALAFLKEIEEHEDIDFKKDQWSKAQDACEKAGEYDLVDEVQEEAAAIGLVLD